MRINKYTHRIHPILRKYLRNNVDYQILLTQVQVFIFKPVSSHIILVIYVINPMNQHAIKILSTTYK